jgi:hypothetical protein
MSIVDGTCPRCGMPRELWEGNGGLGYTEDGVTYCCRGCAENAGCTCRSSAGAPEVTE